MNTWVARISVSVPNQGRQRRVDLDRGSIHTARTITATVETWGDVCESAQRQMGQGKANRDLATTGTGSEEGRAACETGGEKLDRDADNMRDAGACLELRQQVR